MTEKISTPELASLNLQEGDRTPNTVAIDKDTNPIVIHRKSSAQRQGSSKKMVTFSKKEEHINKNGETIQIFRRSRSDRPTSAQSTGSVLEECGQDEDLPAPDTVAGVREANVKLKQVICYLQGDATNDMLISKYSLLISNLEYVSNVVSWIATQKEDEAIGDDLSELQSEAASEGLFPILAPQVRKWLASTFAKQKTNERRTFQSVANAIRTGIFIEKIYRPMSMAIPPDVQDALKDVDNWNFDTFALHQVSKGTPLRYLGYELLTRHGCLDKYKIPPSMLEAMLNHVEAGYTANGNPYHNNMHACDVLQTTHYFISQTGLAVSPLPCL